MACLSLPMRSGHLYSFSSWLRIVHKLGGKTTQNYFSDVRLKLQNKICTVYTFDVVTCNYICTFIKFDLIIWSMICTVMKLAVVMWKNRRKLYSTVIKCRIGLVK